MDDDMTDSIDDLLSELQSSTHIARDVEKQDDFKLDKEDLENFLLQYSGKLIKGSVDYVEDVKQFITSAPDARDVESLSKLVGAAAAAIETLNKIHISDQKAKSTKELKIMDIESKQALQQQDTETKLLLNREELMKQLIGDAQIIDADVTES
jgi:hypothetical protein|tara:strand:+ start:3075 stop:3533 length:459 start_codon:yes stop_codon:yes gene_type:complete